MALPPESGKSPRPATCFASSPTSSERVPCAASQAEKVCVVPMHHLLPAAGCAIAERRPHPPGARTFAHRPGSCVNVRAQGRGERAAADRENGTTAGRKEQHAADGGV